MECQPQQDMCWQCTFLAAVSCGVVLFPSAVSGKGQCWAQSRPRACHWEKFPMKVWGESPCLCVMAPECDWIQHRLGEKYLLQAQAVLTLGSEASLLFEFPNTKFWVPDIGLIQVGFVDKMMWWNWKVMVVCLEKEILYIIFTGLCYLYRDTAP